MIKPNIYKTIMKAGTVIALVGDTSSGKTNALFKFIESVNEAKVNKAVFFYHNDYYDKLNCEYTQISSIEDLESIENSLIFIDEFKELLKIDDRHFQPMIKTMFAQIKHNNNKIVMCGVPDYFKKYISGEVDEWVLFTTTFANLVNGTALKKYISGLSASFIGLTRMSINIGKMLWRGKLIDVEYLGENDRKNNNINDLF